MRLIGCLVLVLALGVLPGGVSPVAATDTADPDDNAGVATPPRLSLVEGRVSFWREGAEDWVEAQLNTPLAPGDELATGAPGSLELQVGARAFLRAGAETQVGLENHEPDFLQLKVTAGGVALDLRELDPGQSFEINTPSAAFSIEHPGYYRVDVLGERTSFITRRGGRATATPASGAAVDVGPRTQVVIEGEEDPLVGTYAAPQSDDWDRWNYARSKELLQPRSARYVAGGTYGVHDLDRHGTWRTVPTYGAVWVPAAVPRGWAPYTTGAWVLDPVYGWTWVDTAPWGWAPYHYGRWVYVDGYWGWAPGPVMRRAVYAPALVAFLGGASLTVGVGPTVGWVALGWGEPLVPWWGRPGFVHVPSWHGWGGPRIVNNVVVTRTTVVTVQHINSYHNTRVQNAVVVVRDTHFGRGRIPASARITHVDRAALRPIHTGPQIAPTASSLAPSTNRGMRPPAEQVQRRVVATRPPHQSSPGMGGHEGRPKPHIVSVPRHGDSEKARPPMRWAPGERAADGARPGAPPTTQRPARVHRDQSSAPSSAAEHAKPEAPGPPSPDRSRDAKSHAPKPPVAHEGRGPQSGEAVKPVPSSGSRTAPPANQRAQHAVPQIAEPAGQAKPDAQARPPAANQGPPPTPRERQQSGEAHKVRRSEPPQAERAAARERANQPTPKQAEPKPQHEERREGNGGPERGHRDRGER